MAEKKKRNKIKVGSLVTPIGTARYPHLNAPDTKWVEEGEYRCPLIFTEEVADQLRPKLEEFLDKGFDLLKKEHYGDAPNTAKAKRLSKSDLPLKAVEDEEGNETGDYSLNLKKRASGTKKDGTPWKAKVNIFDSKGKKLLPVPSIWGGSKLRVDADVFAFFFPKDNTIGLTFEIMGVQVIELVSGSGERESAFGEVDGGYVGEEDPGFGRDDDSTDDEDSDEASADF